MFCSHLAVSLHAICRWYVILGWRACGGNCPAGAQPADSSIRRLASIKIRPCSICSYGGQVPEQRKRTRTQRRAELQRDHYLAKADELMADGSMMLVQSWQGDCQERSQQLAGAAPGPQGPRPRGLCGQLCDGI